MKYNDYDESIEFDRSQFFDLYRDIQNEIKDKVISKLLLTVQKQHKELTILKQENNSLKNHLSYILKRMLLHKNQYINNNDISRNKILGSSRNVNNPLLYNTTRNWRNRGSFKPSGSVENYRCNTECDAFNSSNKKSKNNLNKTIDNSVYIISQPNTTIIDKKIKRYLNTMYRNNFLINNNGLTYNLNKKENIYKELFHTNSQNYQTISNNDDVFLGKKSDNIKFHHRSLEKGNTRNKKEKTSTKNIKKIQFTRSVKPSSKKKLSKIKDYQEELIKDDFDFFDLNEYKYNDYNYNDYNNNDYNDYEGNSTLRNNNINRLIKKSNYHNHKNSKNNYGQKIKAKKDLLYMKSPFLVNKY